MKANSDTRETILRALHRVVQNDETITRQALDGWKSGTNSGLDRSTINEVKDAIQALESTDN